MDTATELADQKAEEALLGSLLVDPTKILPVGQLLGPGGRGIFSEKRNDELYQILVAMAGEGEAIDLVTVGSRMHAEGKFDSIGMRSRLLELCSAVVSGAHARHYATIVRNLAMLRRLKATGVDVARRAPHVAPDEESINEFTTQVEEAIRSDFGRVSSSDGPQETAPTFQMISRRNFDSIILARDGAKTGLEELDQLWGSFLPDQLITIGGRTSSGKTSLALQVVSDVFRSPDKVCLAFSMEMSREEMCLRLIANETGIPIRAMQSKHLTHEQWDQLDRAVEARSRENFIVDETANPTILQVHHSAERIKARFGRLDLVLCDGIQLMRARAENRAQEIGKITRGLKNLAKEIGCPVIATTQLNRGESSDPERMPQLRDLKESSSIEQDSDIVILIWRPQPNDEKHAPTEAKVNVAKQRNGPTGIVELYWSPRHLMFRDAPKPMFAQQA